jgi:hypothetical protein
VLPALIAAVALVLAVLPPDADAAARCPFTRHRTIAATKSVRVYRAFSRTAGTMAAYACALGSTRRVFLGTDSTDAEYTVSHVQIAGRFVAFFEQYSGREGASPDLTVVDVRAAKVLHKETDGEIQSPSSWDGLAIVLSARGSVAWVTEERETATGRLVNRIVEAADADGRRVLDSDPTIDPNSLALAGSWVYWRHAGETRTATLP